MDEKSLMAAFGLEDEAETTAEAAEPQEDEALTAEGEKESQPENAEAGDNTAPQSKEERAKNAARRREAELAKIREEAFAQGRKAEREKISGTIKRIGTADPTQPGKKIESIDDLEAYSERLEGQRMARALQSGNGEEATAAINQAIERHLASKERDAEKTAEKKTEPESEADAKFRAQVDSEIAKISEYDPEIRDVASLLRKEGAKFRTMVKEGGMSFIEAYEFLHRKEIADSENTQRGKQEAEAARASGKSHLRPLQSRGTGKHPVPPGVKDYYRKIFPGITDAEMFEDYNASRNEED